MALYIVVVIGGGIIILAILVERLGGNIAQVWSDAVSVSNQ